MMLVLAVCKRLFPHAAIYVRKNIGNRWLCFNHRMPCCDYRNCNQTKNKKAHRVGNYRLHFDCNHSFYVLTLA